MERGLVTVARVRVEGERPDLTAQVFGDMVHIAAQISSLAMAASTLRRNGCSTAQAEVKLAQACETILAALEGRRQ